MRDTHQKWFYIKLVVLFFISKGSPDLDLVFDTRMVAVLPVLAALALPMLGVEGSAMIVAASFKVLGSST